MAGRIKRLGINSAKSGAARLSEPNGAGTGHLPEPNSSDTAQLTKPNGTDPAQKSPSLRLADANEDSNQLDLSAFSEKTNKSTIRREGNDSGPSDNDPDKSSNDNDDDDESQDTEQSNTDVATGENSATDTTAGDGTTPDSEDATKSSVVPIISSIPDPVSKEELVNAQRPSEMVDGPLRGVAYYRTSTEEENDADARITIDQQKPLVEAAFKAFSVEQAGEPIKDKAISGEIFDDRPGLDKIEELSKNDEINVVIVSDIDRLGRICEKTIEFVKRLRYEHDTYIVANVRWYDVADGDDLETFNAKAGRAEAENKKRGGRGNRGKLFKLLEHGSDSYLSWYHSVPAACVESEAKHGIKLAEDARREIPRLVLDEFQDLDVDRNEYAATKERVQRRLREEFDYEYEDDLDIKSILQNPVYTGRAVLKITQAETHSVDQAEITIPMPELQLYDEEYIQKWEQVQEKIERLNKKYRDKRKHRPEALVTKFGPEMIDDELATWTLICPKCGSSSDYEYYGATEDADGTRRQKCKCSGSDNTHYFRLPTREEWEHLHADSVDEG